MLSKSSLKCNWIINECLSSEISATLFCEVYDKLAEVMYIYDGCIRNSIQSKNVFGKYPFDELIESKVNIVLRRFENECWMLYKIISMHRVL